MSEELYNSVIEDIRTRVRWESRQSLWYEMRNDGLRRKHKPWPNAADAHFPLIDTTINKLKPSFFQQAMGLEVLATFVPMRQQLNSYTTAAEQWFTYKLTSKSNYSKEVMSWIDHCLMSGHSVIKTYWNADKERVEFQAIDPTYIIVPPWTKGVSSADRICHVMPMSLEAYKRAGIYKDDKETINSIKGARNEDAGISNEILDRKEAREGLTYSRDLDQIIVWEVYTRDKDGKWEMECFSPEAPQIRLRDKMEVPYAHGEPPFTVASYEITDGGWYSPRGVCEMLAPFEASLCKLWNERIDSATIYNKPLFRAERDLPNSVNLRMNPGQILPFGITPVPMPAPPMDFDKEMMQTQSTAEQRVTVPDYGIMMDRDRRTATEIESVNAQAQQNMDLRLRLFREALGELFRQAWSLLIQFDSEDLKYRFVEDSLTLDPVSLHDQYEIEPRGGMDMISKQMLINKAVQRKTLFAQSPWVDQVELDKSILELEDPSLIARLIVDPNQKAGNEQDDEKKLIPPLLIGEFIPAQAGLDYQVRIGTLVEFLQGTIQNGTIISPQGQQAIMARLGALLDAMENIGKDTNNARALRKDVMDFLEQAGFMATEDQAVQEEGAMIEAQQMGGQLAEPVPEEVVM